MLGFVFPGNGDSDIDMIEIQVIELPVFAISEERRVVFWNEPMAELTQVHDTFGWGWDMMF